MNAVIYCRVSSKEQIDGTSLETQETACREYARSKHARVAAVFVEQGESAKFADRTQLLALIDFCRQNKGSVDTLLVWKLDRFARNVTDHYSIKSTLLKYGVRVLSVTEPIDSDPTGKLMEGVLASVAQFDNDVRAMRTVQGMQRRLQDGIFPWRPPYGYRSAVTHGEKKNIPDVPDAPVFGLLQRAWRMFATGGYTQADMGRLMHSWGLSSAHGGRFCPQVLFSLFTNPYYAGRLVDPWDAREYDGKHLPMVTKEEFARVQEVIAQRDRSTAHHKDRDDFPLRGFVKCESCLRPLTGAYSRGRNRRYAYYLCQARGCPRRGKSHPVGVVHTEFEALLASLSPVPDLLTAVREMVVEQAEMLAAAASGRIRTAAVRARQVDRELEELIRMRTQQLITDEEFVRQRKLLKGQTISVNRNVPPSISASEVRDRFEIISGPLLNLSAAWKAIRSPYRRRFERMVVPAGFQVGHSRTAEVGHLFSAFSSFRTDCSSLVPHSSSGSNQIILEIVEFSNLLNGVEEEEEPLAA
jgi:site-specific DNA recombinase